MQLYEGHTHRLLSGYCRLRTEYGRFPLQSCRSPNKREPGARYARNTYTIFVGDSVEDWVSFWNHIFTQGQDWRKHWKAICLPADTIMDSETQAAFFDFLRKAAHRVGDHPPTLRWVSCTHSEKDLHEISAPFRWKKLDPIKLHSQRKRRQLDAISRVSQRKEWDLPTLLPEGAISFGLPTNTSAGPDQIQTSFHQVPRTGGFFNPMALPSGSKETSAGCRTYVFNTYQSTTSI